EPARACAPAPQKGAQVDIASETALIIWDSTAKVQHFIRTASFTSTSADFGFLVPTPSRPELAESSEDVFRNLSEITAPRVVTQTKTGGIGCTLGREAPTAGEVENALPGSVKVIETKRVGAFDAAVLR